MKCDTILCWSHTIEQVFKTMGGKSCTQLCIVLGQREYLGRPLRGGPIVHGEAPLPD